MNKQPHHRQRGFTIIELMIATSVLSVILLLVTTVMLNIGNLFYKGFNQARVQDGVRSIADELSNQLELSGSTPIHYTDSEFGPTIQVYCVGNLRYSYITGVQMGKTSGGATLYDIMWRDTPVGGCDQVHAANLTDPNLARDDAGNGTGAELVPPSSQLTTLCIGTLNIVTNSCTYASTSPYTISVGIAYGSTSLLNLAGLNTTCKTTVGDQFCATAQLNITVANRLQTGVI